MSNRSDQVGRHPLGIVISGCGAVTRIYYAEALTRLQIAGTVRVLGVYDPDKNAMAAVRTVFPAAQRASCFEDLLGLGAQAAIIASPPSFHADQSVRALRAGLHVFCEKPLATNSTDASRILSVAEETGLTAAIGLVRRQFPAAQFIKDMLGKGAIGPLRSVTCFEGGPFDWPVASPSYFRRVESGGGVLQDIGTHCLDLLSWWLGAPATIHYADDAIGGIEANCFLRLSYHDFEACVRLSRDWHRPNIYRLEGDAGRIHWMVSEPSALETAVWVGGGDDNSVRKFVPTLSFADCFAAQIGRFVDSLRIGGPPATPASDGAAVLALIERCYANRQLMDMSWLSPEEILQAARLAI